MTQKSFYKTHESENAQASARHMVALVLYHEGFGYGLKELEALAQVVQNRFEMYQNMKLRKTWEDICLEEGVFPRMQKEKMRPIITDAFFAMCSRLAGRVIARSFKSSEKMTRFHHCLELPFWARGKVGQPLGDFIFYT